MGNMQMTACQGKAGEGQLLAGLHLSTLGLSHERVFIPATGSGQARLGLFSPENKTLFQTKAK